MADWTTVQLAEYVRLLVNDLYWHLGLLICVTWAVQLAVMTILALQTDEHRRERRERLQWDRNAIRRFLGLPEQRTQAAQSERGDRFSRIVSEYARAAEAVNQVLTTAARENGRVVANATTPDGTTVSQPDMQVAQEALKRITEQAIRAIHEAATDGSDSDRDRAA